MKRDKNIYQQKSFYFALYSAVIGLAVLASAVTYSNLHSVANKQLKITKKTTQKTEKDLVKPVLNNQTKSYLVPEDRSQKNKNQTDKKSISNFTYSKIALNQSPDTKTEQNLEQKNSNQQKTEKIDQLEQSDHAIKREDKKDKNQDTQEIKLQEQNKTQETNPEDLNNPSESFDSFSEEQKMSWPVFGDIVMDYDDQNLVYDKTLEQYRTNDCISLSAQVGEQVKATADGVVKSVLNTPESGNTIILDHGNGWSTTYSQLQDDLLVSQGDTVKKGQVIGGVGSPTKYGILLGSHLDFKVSHDDNYIDPKSIMVEK